MATKAVKRAAAERKMKEKGLILLAWCLAPAAAGFTYLRKKCGSRVVAGKSKKAGKVMRFKTPTTTMKPSKDEAKMLERFCTLC
jgi:hypothetical protein